MTGQQKYYDHFKQNILKRLKFLQRDKLSKVHIVLLFIIFIR